MKTIMNEIGSVFLPVQDVEKSRDWYCDLFGISPVGDIQFGHLFVIQMEGVNLVLDSKLFQKIGPLRAPIFHLNSNDIQKAYQEMQSRQVELTTGIEHGHWFNFRDLDGNEMMICQC